MATVIKEATHICAGEIQPAAWWNEKEGWYTKVYSYKFSLTLQVRYCYHCGEKLEWVRSPTSLAATPVGR